MWLPYFSPFSFFRRPPFRALFLFLTLIFALNSLNVAQAAPPSATSIEDREEPFLQTEEESLMGEAMMQQLHGSGYVLPDLLVHHYLQSLGSRLAAHVPGLKPNIFAIDSTELNAFAFFGNHIAVHTGLILGVNTESQLAAILAHEMAHLKQRHLSRLLAQQKNLVPLTSAGLLGALLLGTVGNAELGLSAATAILAGRLQHMISYTQECEKEADRFGLQLLSQAFFNPAGMQEALEILQQKKRLEDKPPEYLITHPLCESRIADIQNRTEKLPAHLDKSSPVFEWVQVRLQVAQQTLPMRLIQKFKRALETKDPKKGANSSTNRYGYALALAKNQQFSLAEPLLNELIQENPTEWLLQVSLAEVEQSAGKNTQALNRLKAVYESNHHSLAIAFPYAKLLLKHKKISEGERILLEQKFAHPTEPIIYEALAETAYLKGQTAKVHQLKAEWHFLQGEIETAVRQLDISTEKAGNNRALLKQIETRKLFFKEFLRKTKSFR